MILSAAQMARRRRRAVVLGAGLLHDIPLKELSQMFEQVVLVDIVHTWPCRIAAFRFPNVKLLPLDVTGVVNQLRKVRRTPVLPAPVSKPTEFMDDPFLDFTVSVNIVSQLGWVPSLFLGASRSESEIAAIKSQLIFAHLDYLKRLPGHTALITDAIWRAVPLEENSGERQEVWDVLSGVSLPVPVRAWDWRIAPAPERSRDADFVARVHAYPDWKKAVGSSAWPTEYTEDTEN